eukprot:GDKJ01013620.1.p1 GENE.GDKJ01013620.1~~GDKJ01013620.1.p1  ORF type:complete len:895 (+),score=207.93 GDKJ01013620.1:1-2685(+)
MGLQMSVEPQEATHLIGPNDVVHIKDAFRKFLTELEAITVSESGQQFSEKIYYEKIKKIALQLVPDRHLIVDWNHCIAASEEGMQPLFTLIQSHFAVVLQHLTAVVREMARDIMNNEDARDINSRPLPSISLGFENLAPLREGIRAFSAHMVGRLVAFEATVTRSSSTRPNMESASFKCVECFAEIKNVVQEFKFEKPKVCPGAWDPDQGVHRKCQSKFFELIREDCTFVDWQKLRVQEDATKVPEGSMPRSIDVIMTGDMVEVAHPGDRVRFTGCILSIPDVGSLYRQNDLPKSIARERNRKARQQEGGNEGVSGLASLGIRTLTHRLVFVACHADKSQTRLQNLTNADLVSVSNGVAEPFYGSLSTLDEEEVSSGRVVMPREDWDRLSGLVGSSDLPTRMSQLIASNIFGYDLLKLGVLLMLVGGIPKNTVGDQIQLRGDINVCIVGDPATAKSQLLKFVNSLLHRCVYANGKTSTAAGLTASVNRDPETGDHIIEAGALMLADNGVCCIDGFDKMEPRDMVAIHEAMEQQTISIAKAGIQATLNARASILAACNPILGRYDRTRPLNRNVALTPPIMSRFDLFFVLVDELSGAADEQMAQHIVNVHMNAKPTYFKAFDDIDRSPEDEDARRFLRNYIRYARTFKPFMGPVVREALKKYYVALRKNDAASNKLAYKITVRQLESLIRLSEAMAKSRLSNEVNLDDVGSAFKLLKDSIVPIHKDDVALDEGIMGDMYQETDETEKEKKVDDAPGSSSVDPAVKKGKIKVSFEMYQKISFILGAYLERMASLSVDVTVHELVSWYVSEYYEGDINDEIALQQFEEMIQKIIIRLVKKDNVLIFAESGAELGDISLAIVTKHPNFVISSGFEPAREAHVDEMPRFNPAPNDDEDE